MTRPILFVLAVALSACRSSRPSDTSEAGVSSTEPVAAPPSAEQPPATAASEAPPAGRPSTPTGSTSAKAPPPAPPLSSSLSELGQAPLPDIEGEPTIAVFVERISGGLMPDIEHATGRLRAGMRACYLRYLGDEPPDASRMSVRIVVSTNGSVKSARPEGVSEIDPPAVDCMVRRAQAATFPPPLGEPAEIVLSIAFLPPRLP
jgi:hypothetical protein